MFFLIYPLIFGILLVPDPGPSKAALADFSRLERATDEAVYIVDQSGQERYVKLLGVSGDRLTFGIGPQTFSMDKATVLRVDRPRDRTIDGILKGAAVGLLLGLVAQQGLDEESAGFVMYSTAVYGGIGWAVDRANSNRSTLYRAQGPQAGATVSIKF